jgi:hypothetical protein
MVAPELPSQEGRARSPGTCGSAGAHLSKEVRLDAEEHVAAPELTSVRMRGPGPWDTWQLWSHLCREVCSETTAYVVAHGCML